jgi:hypothetical protein
MVIIKIAVTFAQQVKRCRREPLARRLIGPDRVALSTV